MSLNAHVIRDCKNCDTAFKGNFCPNCGQSVKEFQKPLKYLLNEFVGNVFAFDTRFWQTSIAVLLQPGRLTLNYTKGHRVRYMPPFRFFVFISFIFFFTMSQYAGQLVERGKSEQRAENLEGQKGETKKEEGSLNRIDHQINTSFKSDEQLAVLTYLVLHPEIYIEKFLGYFSWTIFVFIPFYSFLLWLFYRKSRRYYITHFIFSINQHAFVFAVLSAMVGFSLLFPTVRFPFHYLVLALIPIHFYFGYKTLYRQTPLKTLLKLVALITIYASSLLVVTVVLIFVVLDQIGIDLSKWGN